MQAIATTIVNSTHYWEISEDPNNPISLSPQHLLTLRESVVPNVEKVSRDDSSCYGQMRWRRVRYLSDQFRARWKSDYLSNLQFRNKWRKSSTNLKVDDEVLFKEDSTRSHWPMGRIVEALLDQYGQVRKVILVCTTSKDSKPKVFQRAIHQLVRLMWPFPFSFLLSLVTCCSFRKLRKPPADQRRPRTRLSPGPGFPLAPNDFR